MSVVLVHNVACRSKQDFLDDWDIPESEFRELTFWNIWQRRLCGWDLSEGESVILMASWPGKRGRARQRRLMLEVRAHDVAHWEVSNWNAAVSRLARWCGASLGELRANPYTAAKKDRQGPLYVLAWRPAFVRWLVAPAPRGLAVGQNGWSSLEVESLPSKATPEAGDGARTRGQGRRLDIAARRAIENHAMNRAKAWCREQGWREIMDTSANQAWDLEAVDTKGKRRYVEVKGTTGPPSRFEVTAGEVKAALKHGADHQLLAVHHIGLSRKLDGSFAPRGGEIEVFDPWEPHSSELIETRYTWVPR